MIILVCQLIKPKTLDDFFYVKKISKPVPADGAIPLVLTPWF